MAEVLRREFSCPALYGLRCRGGRHGGDYDVVALMEGWLLYMEVKSSPRKTSRGLKSIFSGPGERFSSPPALFFVDTEPG